MRRLTEFFWPMSMLCGARLFPRSFPATAIYLNAVGIEEARPKRRCPVIGGATTRAYADIEPSLVFRTELEYAERQAGVYHGRRRIG
jgi:hypothetical protein